MNLYDQQTIIGASRSIDSQIRSIRALKGVITKRNKEISYLKTELDACCQKIAKLGIELEPIKKKEHKFRRKKDE